VLDKTDSHVIPGNIIYKQRGTIWYPGENCGMGRDHTIHALVEGYVKYYKDPKKHPDRQYIGVVFDKSDKLPYPEHAMRKRRLNMTATKIVPREVEQDLSPSGIPNVVVRPETNRAPQERNARRFRLRPELGYAYKEEMWHLAQSIRTEKRKLGSRRHAMRRRRAKRMAILSETRTMYLDKMATRREDSLARRKARKEAALAAAARADITQAKAKSPTLKA
jgi:large subunit ribosomal protein L27